MERLLIFLLGAMAFCILVLVLWMMTRPGPAATPGEPDVEDGSIQFK